MNTKLILSFAFSALMTACGGNHDAATSAVMDSSYQSQSFHGAMAVKLRDAMSHYAGAIVTANGYKLQGLNTSVSCTYAGICTVTGPGVQAGQLKIDLGSYDVTPNATAKPIQQQLFEVVQSAPDYGVGATGISSLSICEIVVQSQYKHCDKAGDILSVSLNYNHWDQNSPKTYSAVIDLTL